MLTLAAWTLHTSLFWYSHYVLSHLSSEAISCGPPPFCIGCWQHLFSWVVISTHCLIASRVGSKIQACLTVTLWQVGSVLLTYLVFRVFTPHTQISVSTSCADCPQLALTGTDFAQLWNTDKNRQRSFGVSPGQERWVLRCEGVWTLQDLNWQKLRIWKQHHFTAAHLSVGLVSVANFTAAIMVWTKVKI